MFFIVSYVPNPIPEAGYKVMFKKDVVLISTS